eukprot:TRINITY_DN15066_c0_g1_i1.p1 TRINITY_DN15066_c0_g1~~TRINITY_DN15066_c0_g1_i1.p1  ORF type:complete len:359 (-),score=74.09 TRINITY_DN15066_c0_g1_i1:185-1150(-)
MKRGVNRDWKAISDDVFKFNNRYLIDAIDNSNVEAVKFLLTRKGIDPSQSIFVGKSEDFSGEIYAIVQAGGCKNIEIVRELLDRGVDASVEGNEAIKIAVYDGSLDIVKLLVQDKKVYDRADSELLKLVVAKNYVEVASQIIKPHLCGDGYYPYLTKAVEEGNIEMFKLFMDRPKIDGNLRLTNILSLAANGGHHKMVDYMLNLHKIPPHGDAMKRPAELGYHEVVELFLKDGRASPDGALLSAACNGHHKVVEILLMDERIDPTIDDDACIRTANIFNHDKVIELLYKHPKNRVTKSELQKGKILPKTDQGRKKKIGCFG